MLGVRVSNMLVSGYGQGLSNFFFIGLKGCRKKGGVRTPWTPPLDPPLHKSPA